MLHAAIINVYACVYKCCQMIAHSQSNKVFCKCKRTY